jgi:hypothetical protein
MKPNTDLHLMQRSSIVELYFHSSLRLRTIHRDNDIEISLAN